jgi:transposase
VLTIDLHEIRVGRSRAEDIVARSKNGEAISAERRTEEELLRLKELAKDATASGNLETWRRSRAVLGYLGGRRVVELAQELDVTRGSVNRWLQWFEAEGTAGLLPRKPTGGPPRLTQEQRDELAGVIEAGPQSAGFVTGVWTGPMIGEFIRRRFHVRYHNHHIPRLLHKMGFSVQRPRKRLAKADLELQAVWLRDRLPAIKKKPRTAAGS